MHKRFSPVLFKPGHQESRSVARLRIAVCSLALVNLIALFLCFHPIGGTQDQLRREGIRLRVQTDATRRQTTRLRMVSSRVQVGGKETSEFQAQCILPKRLAYSQVIAEIQRMSKAAGLQERDGVFTEEPIEGTPDLAVLNNTANYQGSYENLLRFLHEADRSPMLLMLDNLQAAPEQKGGQINVSIRFQAVIRERASSVAGVQP